MGIGLAGKGTGSGTGFEVGSRPGWTGNPAGPRLPQQGPSRRCGLGVVACFRACMARRLPASRSRADFSGLMETSHFAVSWGLRLSAKTKQLLLKLC